MLKDGKTAILVPHDDVERWVQAIESLLDSPDKRQDMEESARESYFAEFVPEQRIQKILSGL